MTYELHDKTDEDLEEEQGESMPELGGPVPGQAFTDESSFSPYAYTLEIGADGLPMEVTQPWQSADTAPIPLTCETMQCLRQPPDKWDPEGQPVCKHYKRQRVHSAAAPDKPMLMRFCTRTELRGINGAALVLDDSGIFECEFRDPPCKRSTLVLDTIDHHKIRLGQKRLEQEALTGRTHGFRMFRTAEDVAAGRYVVPDDEDEQSVDLIRPRISKDLPDPPDPLGPDDDDEPTENEA